MKTQNMIVLMVEFTRIPLFPAGEKPLTKNSSTARTSLDVRRFLEVTESTRRYAADTHILPLG
jgi:hypothetical protein